MKKLLVLSLLLPLSMSLSACGKSDDSNKQSQNQTPPAITKQDEAKIKTSEKELLATPDESTIKDDGKNLIANGF